MFEIARPTVDGLSERRILSRGDAEERSSMASD